MPKHMSGVVQKKIRNYLAIRRGLIGQYRDILEGKVDLDLYQSLVDLYDFDQLCYSYYALRSYYDLSKARWDLDYRNLLDDFVLLRARIEDKIPLGDLYNEVGALPLLRRELKENAREGGKVAYLIVSLSADMDVLGLFLGAELDADDIVKVKTQTTQKAAKKKELDSAKPDSKVSRQSTLPIQPAPEKTKEVDTAKLAPVIEKPAARKFGAAKAVVEKIAEKVAEKVTKKATEKSVADKIREKLAAQKFTAKVAEKDIEAKGIEKDVEKGIEKGIEKPVAGKATEKHVAEKVTGETVAEKVTEKTVAGKATEKPSAVVSQNMEPGKISASDTTSTVSSVRVPVVQKQTAQREHNVEKQIQTPQSEPIQPVSTASASQNTGQGLKSTAKAVQDTATPVLYNQQGTDKTVPQTHRALEVQKTNESEKSLPVQYQLPKPSSVVSQTIQSTSRIETPSKPAAQPKTYVASSKRQLVQTPSSKRIHTEGNFYRFATWTREHDECVFRAAASHPSNITSAIKSALSKKFAVSILLDESRTLQLHYGILEETMFKYQYLIQAFQLVASQYYANKLYVTVPWAEIRMHFARNTGVTLEDWEVRGRYLLFLLHRRVYGIRGEPVSNYGDLAEEYHRIFRFRNQQSTSGNTSLQAPARLEFSSNTSISIDDDSEIWTPNMVSLLITAHTKIPLDTPNRMLSIKNYLLLESGKSIDVKVVEERLKWRDVVVGIEKAQAAAKMHMAGVQSQNGSQGTHDNVGNQSQEGRQGPQNTINQSKGNKSIPGTQPKDSRFPNQFDKLLEDIEHLTRPEWYYQLKIKKSSLTDFWDFDKCKCIYVTVEFFAKIPADVPDLTLRVSRSNLKKIIRLRLLRVFRMKVLESLVENKLMHMMEQDVFDANMVALINSNLGKGP